MLTTNAKYKLGSKLVPKEDSLKASRQGPGELRRPWGVLKGLKLKFLAAVSDRTVSWTAVTSVRTGRIRSQKAACPVQFHVCECMYVCVHVCV